MRVRQKNDREESKRKAERTRDSSGEGKLSASLRPGEGNVREKKKKKRRKRREKN